MFRHALYFVTFYILSCFIFCYILCFFMFYGFSCFMFCHVLCFIIACMTYVLSYMYIYIYTYIYIDDTFTCFFQISQIWDNLLTSVTRRNFLLQFSKNPREMVDKLLNNTFSDYFNSSSNHLIDSSYWWKENEISDKETEFYKQVKIQNHKSVW